MKNLAKESCPSHSKWLLIPWHQEASRWIPFTKQLTHGDDALDRIKQSGIPRSLCWLSLSSLRFIEVFHTFFGDNQLTCLADTMKLPNTHYSNGQNDNDDADCWNFSTRTIYPDIPRVTMSPSPSLFLRAGASFMPRTSTGTIVAIIQEALDLVADISFGDELESPIDQCTPTDIDACKIHKNSKGH